MLRLMSCSAILVLLASSSWAREQSVFRAGQPGDVKAAAEDRRKIVDELRLKYQAAVDDLAKNDASAATRAKQKDIADLLDKLLNQDSDPPPQNPPPATEMPPSSRQDPPAPPRSPNPEPKKTPENTPAPAQNLAPKNASVPKAYSAETKKSVGEAERSPMTLNEMQKQKPGGWGDLPPRARPDIDAYGRDRFMPCYEDVLRAYYRSLAESGRRKDGE